MSYVTRNQQLDRLTDAVIADLRVRLEMGEFDSKASVALLALLLQRQPEEAAQNDLNITKLPQQRVGPVIDISRSQQMVTTRLINQVEEKIS